MVATRRCASHLCCDESEAVTVHEGVDFGMGLRGGEGGGGDDGIERGGLGGGVGGEVGAGPDEAEACAGTAVVGENAARVVADEGGIGRVGCGLVERGEVAQEDAFELRCIGAAVGFAAVVEDAVCVCQGGDGCGGDLIGLAEQCGIWNENGELGEAAEDDALIVGPGGGEVVVAGLVEAVVDEAFVVDHAGVLEPFPLALSPGEVLLLMIFWNAGGEVGGDGEKELVGDGVLVGTVLAPPDTAGAGVIPAAGHIGEDALGHVQIVLLMGLVVGVDPGKGPPALVVVIVVEEAGEFVLGDVEGEGEDGLEVGPGGDAAVVGKDGDGVGGVPPAGGAIEACGGVVPALQGVDARACAVTEVLRGEAGGKKESNESGKDEALEHDVISESVWENP